MAERRMFAKTIIDSDVFLDMPLSTQALYFHLSMRADDEGFINNPRKIQRMIGASDDDLKLLSAKNFLIPFESGVVVIKHWKIHNYIRTDRLHSTKYTDEKAALSVKENGAYTIMSDICQSNVSQLVGNLDTEDRLGKDRLGKDRLGKDRLGKDRLGKDRQGSCNYQQIADMYNDTCVSFPRLTTLSEARQKAIKARLNVYSLEDFRRLFTKAQESTFLKGANNRNWTATFDWLIKDTNMAKVLDGNYDNRSDSSGGMSKPSNKVAQQLDDFYKMAAEFAESEE